MTEKEITLIRHFKSLIEQKVHVHLMSVFGSRARGNAGEESDLDILVVIEEPETGETLDFIFDCAFDAGLERGILLSPTVFSRDRWENSPERSSPLVSSIKLEGIPV